MPNFGIVNSSLVEFLRNDFYRAITSGVTCPIVGSQVIIYDNPQNLTIDLNPLTYPNFKIGNYYKIPNSSQLDSSGQILPKYSANIPPPYFGFVYPVGDINYGYMLVKTFQPLSNIANDIIIINESQVLSELQRVVQTIFAM